VAIKKALERAKKSMVTVSLKGDTIPHEVFGHYGAGKVLLRPASSGTGLIAGGASRAVLEVVGVRNVLCKSLGTSNPHNVVSATMKGLLQLRSAETVAALRGKTVEEIS
jgi:small subunit ribosomal protein S5